jgi:crotonobetainyl-CoA:carnitine CoA-transferase CaiB-like acyl-CoA transferase
MQLPLEGIKVLDLNNPVGAINNLAQVVEHPQVKARGSIVEIDHPRAGKLRDTGALG